MTKDPFADDLFNSSAMTIGDHLEELRKSLFKSVACLVGFTLVGLYFADRVVDWIKQPLETALMRYYLDYSQSSIKKRLATLAAAGERVPDLDLVMQAVRQDKLFPTPVYFDPEEVQRQVADFSEGFSAASPKSLNLPAHSTELVARDFADLPGFCKKVLAQSQSAAQTPGKRLFELLPPPAQAVLRKAAGEPAAAPTPGATAETAAAAGTNASASTSAPAATTAPAAPAGAGKLTDAETGVLLAGLNAVLGRSDFYDSAAFDGVGLTVEQVDLAKRVGSLADYERMRFNRWILSDAFGGDPKTASRRQSMIRVLQWTSIEDDPRIRVKSLNTQEMFVVYLKAALLFGVVVGSPFIFYYLWEFVASGLYPHERKYVYFFLPLSVGLFLFGAFLAFFFVFQFVLDFLLSFNKMMNVDPDIRITEWLGLALMLPLGFGLSFQLPLVMLFLERIGLMSIESYLKRWREAVFTIAVLSAILSPGGDPYSMLFMFVPLVFLYYLGIALCKYWPKSRNPFGQAALDG